MHLPIKKGQQVRVDLISVRHGQAVRGAGINFQRGIFDERGRAQSRRSNRHNLVVITVNEERWHVELLQVFRLICFRKHLDAVVGVLEYCA